MEYKCVAVREELMSGTCERSRDGSSLTGDRLTHERTAHSSTPRPITAVTASSSVRIGRRRRHWPPAKQRQHRADAVDVGVFERQIKLVTQVRHAERTRHAQTAVVIAPHSGPHARFLVRRLAGDFCEQVFNRDDAVGAAVLVDDPTICARLAAWS